MTQSPISTLVTRSQHEAAVNAIRRGISTVRIPAPLTLSQWADEHFYLSSESSAIEGPWETLPFQRDVMDCISNDDIRIIDWLKCARIGYTKILMAAAGYFVEHKKRSGAIYQPTDSDANEFSKSEVDPMIRDVPVMSAALDGDSEKRGRKNTLELKQFLGALLYIRGGATPRSYRRLTIDWVAYDELEGFDRDVGEEGDPVTLGDARITNSPFPKSIRGSTPRLKHDSLIAGEAERARHFFRYLIPCPECDTPQPMVFGNLRWDKDKPETARYVCEHCNMPWHYADLYQHLESGFWGTAEGYSIRDANLLDPDGMIVDWPRHIAFHLWAAYSPFFTWQELVEEWLEAVAASKTGDVRKLKAFTNTRLAEAWEDQGEQVAHDTLYARREAYSRPPAGVLLITTQIDVQDNRLELEAVGWGRGEESWGIEYRVIYGDPTQLEVWNELEQVISQTFTTEDNRELAIAAVVIDTGHLAYHVYEFYKRSRHQRIFCIKGMGGEEQPIVSAPHQRKSGQSSAAVPLFLMGANVCKSITYKRLQIEKPGAGYCHFPDSYDEDYFLGLTAEKRILKKRRGFEVVEWHKVRPRNEQLDIRAMGILAMAVLNPLWDALDPENVRNAIEEQPETATPPYMQRPGRGVPKKGFVNKWRR